MKDLDQIEGIELHFDSRGSNINATERLRIVFAHKYLKIHKKLQDLMIYTIYQPDKIYLDQVYTCYSHFKIEF